MEIDRLENLHDGWGYFIPSGTPFGEFPEEALALLDEQDRTIYLDPIAHLDGILASRDFDVMSEFVQQMKQGGLMGLEAQFAPDVGPGLKALYFRFLIGETGYFSLVQFSKAEPDPTLPSALVSTFKVFDAVDCTFDASFNQIHHPRLASPFTDMGWMEPSDEIDIAECFDLYSDAAGDTVGWHRDGRAVLCLHGKVSVIGTVSEFLTAYFANLILEERECEEARDYVIAIESLREAWDEED